MAERTAEREKRGAADAWRRDATRPTEYHVVPVRSGREFILRMNTGADLWLAMQRFAVDHAIRFGKVHVAFMGGLQPARFLVWAPHPDDPDHWHHEQAMDIQNLSMILALGGIIHPRTVDGHEEPFPAVHAVIGGAWNVPTVGGHLLPGSIVKGAFELFITELAGIELLAGPPDVHGFPENWYRAQGPTSGIGAPRPREDGHG